MRDTPVAKWLRTKRGAITFFTIAMGLVFAGTQVLFMSKLFFSVPLWMQLSVIGICFLGGYIFGVAMWYLVIQRHMQSLHRGQVK
jgi:hypothetical protein